MSDELDAMMEGRILVHPAHPMSKQDELIKQHVELCQKALALLQRKNNDYATEDDPFRNFRTFGKLGILVRMSDKLQRLINFQENGKLSVADESAEDSAIDLINYTILLMAYK